MSKRITDGHKVRAVLNRLAMLNGDEAFVAPGYSYYEDAESRFIRLLRNERAAIRQRRGAKP